MNTALTPKINKQLILELLVDLRKILVFKPDVKSKDLMDSNKSIKIRHSSKQIN